MDFVKEQEKMFDFACTAGINEYFYDVSELNDPQHTARKTTAMPAIIATGMVCTHIQTITSVLQWPI